MTTNTTLPSWTILLGTKGQKFECQALSINSAIQQCEEAHPSEAIISATQDATKKIEVTYWGSERYQNGSPLSDNFHMEITDQRQSNGQMYIDVASADGNIDNILSMTVEINRLPDSNDDTQCVHLHFDSDNLAMSIFKQGSTYILRPETGVTIRDTLLPDGQRAYILE